MTWILPEHLSHQSIGLRPPSSGDALPSRYLFCFYWVWQILNQKPIQIPIWWWDEQACPHLWPKKWNNHILMSITNSVKSSQKNSMKRLKRATDIKHLFERSGQMILNNWSFRWTHFYHWPFSHIYWHSNIFVKGNDEQKLNKISNSIISR